MLSVRLYIAQRVSAIVMAPLVIVHLGVMIYAVQGGLSATEILGRTQGSIGWGMFYGLFVLAVAIHAAIGLRVIVFEYFNISGRALDIFTALIAIACLLLGTRAIYAVVT